MHNKRLNNHGFSHLLVIVLCGVIVLLALTVLLAETPMRSSESLTSIPAKQDSGVMETPSSDTPQTSDAIDEDDLDDLEKMVEDLEESEDLTINVSDF